VGALVPVTLGGGMRLSLRALELLFDSTEAELKERALTDKWKEHKEGDEKVPGCTNTQIAESYIVQAYDIERQLDHILSDPELISQYYSRLSQSPFIVLEIGKALPKSMITKFEKLMFTKIENKKITKIEKFPECSQRSRSFSNSMNISIQDSDTKEDNHCKENDCKPLEKSQKTENKEDTKSLQCTVNPTVNPIQKTSNALTMLNSNQLDESEDWLDIETTVNLTGLSRQTIQKKIKQNKYQIVKASKPVGGLKTFINVHSLPVTYQQRYKQQLIERNRSGQLVVGVSSEFSKFSEEARKRAFAKETIIKTYEERRKIGKKQGHKLKDVDMYFQRDINRKNILVEELKILGRFDISHVDLIDSNKDHILSLQVVKKWRKMWKDADRDITVLCDNYENSGNKRSWPQEVEVFIATLAMHPNGYSYKHIYNKTFENFGQISPNYQAVKRFMKTVVIPQNRPLQAAIQGTKATRKISSYVSRINDAYPGDVWISDGYVNKFLVYSPYHMHNDRSKRHLLRPVVIYWLDQATELITGYAASFSERFDVVISSFDHAVDQYGVPKSVMTDNANSYHNPQTDPHKYAKRKKDSEGKKTAVKLLNSGFPGFFQSIGVERVIWVTPGNPQAKKIEPYNHKIFDEFERDQFTYLGKTPEKRREEMKLTNHVLIKKHGEKILTWEQYIGALEAHVENWNNTKRKHLNDMSAHDYYMDFSKHYPFKKLTPEERFIKMTARKTLKLRSSQFELLGNVYEHPSLEAFIDTEIQVIYNIRDLYSLHIATIEGRVLEGQAHLVTYGSQTDQIQTADAIHAKNYYKKRNKAVYNEMVQMGGLTTKLTARELDQAYDNAMYQLEAEDTLRIDHKIKELHKNATQEIDKITNKKAPKSKEIHNPKNPRPFLTEIEEKSRKRIEKEQEKAEVKPEKRESLKLIEKIKREKGLI
jgi:hypothetical protein